MIDIDEILDDHLQRKWEGLPGEGDGIPQSVEPGMLDGMTKEDRAATKAAQEPPLLETPGFNQKEFIKNLEDSENDGTLRDYRRPAKMSRQAQENYDDMLLHDDFHDMVRGTPTKIMTRDDQLAVDAGIRDIQKFGAKVKK